MCVCVCVHACLPTHAFGAGQPAEGGVRAPGSAAPLQPGWGCGGTRSPPGKQRVGSTGADGSRGLSAGSCVPTEWRGEKLKGGIAARRGAPILRRGISPKSTSLSFHLLPPSRCRRDPQNIFIFGGDFVLLLPPRFPGQPGLAPRRCGGAGQAGPGCGQSPGYGDRVRQGGTGAGGGVSVWGLSRCCLPAPERQFPPN